MPTIEDWLALKHTEETPLMVELFKRRPDWLPTGRLEEEVLVWFDSDWPGLPLYLDYEEFTVGWNIAHYHLYSAYTWPKIDVVAEAIETIEGILAGRLLRFCAETPQGQWHTAGFVAPEAMQATVSDCEEKGWIVMVNHWPGRVVYRTSAKDAGGTPTPQ